MEPDKIIIKDPADRFDLSYVFANNFPALGKDKNALVEMAGVAREIAPGQKRFNGILLEMRITT